MSRPFSQQQLALTHTYRSTVFTLVHTVEQTIECHMCKYTYGKRSRTQTCVHTGGYRALKTTDHFSQPLPIVSTFSHITHQTGLNETNEASTTGGGVTMKQADRSTRGFKSKNGNCSRHTRSPRVE